MGRTCAALTATTTTGGPEAIPGAQKSHGSRDKANDGDRPGPPELCGEEEKGVGPRERPAVDGDNSELRGLPGIVFVEAFLNPGALQWSEIKSTAGRGIFDEPGKPAAGLAVPIIENPTAEPVAIC